MRSGFGGGGESGEILPELVQPRPLSCGSRRAGDLTGRPTLCRLVCEGFEAFLTDDGEAETDVVVGLIPRVAIAPWWTAMCALGGAEIARLEQRLARLPIAPEPAELEEFARLARAAALRWTERLLAGSEGATTLPPPVSDACRRPPMQAHMRQIARVLRLGDVLLPAIRAVLSAAESAGRLRNRRIVELDPAVVDAARTHYGRLAAEHPGDAHYLLHAVFNRLQRPAQILHLVRAVADIPTAEPATTGTDGLASVGRRLAVLLRRLVDEIEGLVGELDRGGLSTPVVGARLEAALNRYAELAGDLSAQAELRRSSGWGEAFLKSRHAMRRAFGGGRLSRLAETALAAVGGGGPDEAAIQNAAVAVRLLRAVAVAGEDTEFAAAARGALAGVEREIRARGEALPA